MGQPCAVWSNQGENVAPANIGVNCAHAEMDVTTCKHGTLHVRQPRPAWLFNCMRPVQVLLVATVIVHGLDSCLIMMLCTCKWSY